MFLILAIDCAEPDVGMGAVITDVVDSNKKQVSCAGGYRLEGCSEDSDTEIYCMENRHWSLGTLRCIGMYCHSYLVPAAVAEW